MVRVVGGKSHDRTFNPLITLGFKFQLLLIYSTIKCIHDQTEVGSRLVFKDQCSAHKPMLTG